MVQWLSKKSVSPSERTIAFVFLSSNFLAFQTSGGILLMSAAFLLWFFSQCCVKFFLLVWRRAGHLWLLGGLRADSWNVLSTSEVFVLGRQLFLPLPSFTLCDCLFSEFLILSIWLWMYFGVLVSFLWVFWSFCLLVFVEFLLLSKDTF